MLTKHSPSRSTDLHVLTYPSTNPKHATIIIRGGMYPKSATYSAPSDSDIQNGIGTLNPNTLTITAKGYHDEREREGERDIKVFIDLLLLLHQQLLIL